MARGSAEPASAPCAFLGAGEVGLLGVSQQYPEQSESAECCGRELWDHAAISGDAHNTTAPALSSVLSPAPTRVFATWRRVWIPEPTVDLIEAYMLSVLEPHGLTLHFIDDFHSYHIAAGEVHCGTNARREPPELTSPRRWWDDYDPEYDVTYDPAG